MHIEKTFAVAASVDRVWAFITSPDQVGPCMPGCQHVEITGPGTYQAVISVKIGPIKTTFNFTIETVEERPPEFAVFSVKGEEGGSSSRVTAENLLTLKAIDNGNTEVTYASNVTIVGRLGKFAGGIMQKMAEHMSEQFITAFRERVETEQATNADEPAGTPIGSPGLLAALARFLRNLAAPILNLFGRDRSP
ncbi:MAG: carbon monoxide dehydrogenase subunit G [Glaciimonas sp.]|nr:carbon monoxide dehydrogenase subunit G [Glaciimonas sp.]